MKNKKLWVSILAGILAALMLGTLMVGLIPSRVSAASSSEIRNQINDLEAQDAEITAQLDELESQMSGTMDEIEEAVEQKKLLDQQIFLLFQQINNINSRIATYGVLIADKQDELDDATARYQELSDQNRLRVRAMEENGSLSYWSVLFKANSFADLLDRLSMIEEIAAADQRRLQDLDEAAKKVAAAREELETEKKNLEDIKASKTAAQAELEEKREAADQMLEDLRARGEEFDDLIGQSKDKHVEVSEEIAAMENEYDEAVNREYWATYVPPPTTAPSGDGGLEPGEKPDDLPSSGGTWGRPLDSYSVTSPFGWREHPIWGGQRFHEGVDLSSPAGSPIYAIRGGVVHVATYNDSCGYFVSIDHDNGFRSIYMHMTYFVVSAGQYVNQGECIGVVGSTGDSTGPHLHLGMVYNGSFVNPMDYIP